MCLTINKDITKEIRSNIKDGTVKFYKKYRVNNGGKVVFLYRSITGPIPGAGPVFSKEGVTKSNRKTNKVQWREAKRGDINVGIHTFSYAPAVMYDEFSVSVTIDMNDYVSSGNSDDAVFTKIKVDLDELRDQSQ